MKIIEFKFDIGTKVTTADGVEGIVGILMHKEPFIINSNGNIYQVNIKKPINNKLYILVSEDELLEGHNLFKHERPLCPSY